MRTRTTIKNQTVQNVATPGRESATLIDDGASLTEGSFRNDSVLASETGSLRRLLEACGLSIRTLPVNLSITHKSLIV
jgi:hypothetical protein